MGLSHLLISRFFFFLSLLIVVSFFFPYLLPICLFLHRKSDNKVPEMTLERAVNLLTQDNEETLVCAAGHIQNQCFKSIEAKKMVCCTV